MVKWLSSPADGGVFVIRRDVKTYAWINTDELEEEIKRAKELGGYLIVTVEDPDLKNPMADKAFQIILNSNMDSQDPLDFHPLVKSTNERRN